MNNSTMINCKCGAKPKMPNRVKGIKNVFLIRCENSACPAKVQREGIDNCIDRWNDMSMS